jgi:outer membrane biosynthesis protein TonB
MLRGFALSTLIHASVLAMAMMSWPQPESECDKAIERLRRENPGIRSIEIIMQLPQCAAADLPIDFEDVGLVSNVTELRKAPEPVDEPAPPEPEVEDIPPETPAPQPAAAEPEDAVAVPDPTVKPEEAKKPEPKKPEPKKPEPLVKKDPPKKPVDDLAFLDDFDKALQDKRQTTPRKAAQETPDRPALGNADRDREGVGEATGNTASLQASLRRQIGYCWRGIEDLPKEDQIDVTLSMTLERDGSLAENAKPVSPRTRPVGRSGLAYDLAFRAVSKCAPYNLPEDSYEQWKEIEVTIGPKQG